LEDRRWALPERRRITLPVPVILNLLATDLLVFFLFFTSVLSLTVHDIGRRDIIAGLKARASAY